MLEKNGGGAIIHISVISLTESMRTTVWRDQSGREPLHRNAGKTLAPKGIRVNAICQGSIYFKGGVWDDAKKNNPTLYDNIKPVFHLGATAWKIATVAVFLGSDAGRWVTGQAIAVDGGQAL